MWDLEVDVLSVGGVIGALASAVISADADAEVLVASSPAHHGGWLADEVVDTDTHAYFASLCEGLASIDPLPEAELPVRVVRDLSADEQRSRTVPPFRGGRLRNWVVQCLTSPYGLMHTRVAGWATTTMRTADDEPVEAKLIGTMAVPPAGGTNPLVGWLFDEAHGRGIDVRADARLQRLVFEDGVVAGAVLATSTGPCLVRARHGVTLAPGVMPITDGCGDFRAGDEVEVALVRQTASRFARVEVLSNTPPGPSRSATCAGTTRVLTHQLRDARRGRSETRRYREVNGHPPRNQ
ncbi:FAD-binding protein [Mycobacterium sp. PS03-16]|uniref:FAD-binding protein n=1 Tax=Mycobacterium sp. PS03-16 TaxID=2559611 RepID=UPI0010730C1A|nr:FAD-binding protein [Mycobacterium sp. PS03-16]TFV60291.1 FAD-binding protein [Mycobacterium sp. PS03-16]